MKKLTIVMSLLAVAALSGCSHQPRLTWNDYQDRLYDHYGQTITDDEYLAALLEAVEDSKKTGITLAPGLYAEIGTFYARAGKLEDAIPYYEMEAKTWPESKPFMDDLVTGIKRHLALKNQQEKSK